MNQPLKTTAVIGLLALSVAAAAGPGAAEKNAPARPPARAAAAAAAAAAPEAEPSDVPVRQVVLFSSGVGYFEHFGSVEGDGSTELRFKTDQINDVLKSLVLQDLDGGEVAAVTYPSQEPVSRTLKSFQVDITDNPPLEDLLNQLRGARLTVTLDGDPGDVTGTIVGVQTRKKPKKPAGAKKDDEGGGEGGDEGGGEGGGEGGDNSDGKDDDDKGGGAEIHVLNLKAGRRIRSIPVESIQGFEFEDPKLDAELDRALTALAQSRDQDKKPVTVRFRGEGERRVRMGYVVETPIWKTSYRLILSDEVEEKEAKEGAKARKGEGEKQAGGAGGGGGQLQGWAIVENQTDSDWNNVQLSLVSGRPISFIQELYRPLYVPRPVVQPELYASLRPQTYEGGMTDEERLAMEQRLQDFADAPNFNLESSSDSGPTTGPSGGGGGLFDSGESEDEGSDGAMDPVASVRSAASAGRLGELFQYTVRNVSLPRQRSAMIPIVTDPVEVEKLSIYNVNVLERHPLNGARVKNTTDKHLLQGPVTVLDAGSYAGDARIDDVPPGQERLISYGIDLQVLVDWKAQDGEGTLLTGKIVDGVLTLTRQWVVRRVYTAQNKSNVDKTLVIEHGREEGFTLVSPESAEETTDDLYRFERALPAGQRLELAVKGSTTDLEQVQLLAAQADGLAVYAAATELPKPVRDALAEVVRMKAAMSDLERQVNERVAKVAGLTAEQGRIRENMKAVGRGDEYYNRMVKKLTEQETTIETLQAETAAAQQKLERQRKDLAAYLAKLDAGAGE